MSITIRRLTEDDWIEFSQIRLKALQTDPEVFGSNYEKESQMTEADWRGRCGQKIMRYFCFARAIRQSG
jgi:hypothetical protein